MYDIIIDVLAKQFKKDRYQILPTAKLTDDLGADSLDVMELLMTMEQDYGITVSDEDIIRFTTVQDIVDYVEAHK